jgi:hypothetical protein
LAEQNELEVGMKHGSFADQVETQGGEWALQQQMSTHLGGVQQFQQNLIESGAGVCH